MSYRTNVRGPAVTSAFTITSSTSVGLTIAGSTGKSIYLTNVVTSYVLGAVPAQAVPQALRIFDGATEIFRATSLAGLNLPFYNPIQITRGNALVVTSSVSVNTISGAISLQYYLE